MSDQNGSRGSSLGRIRELEARAEILQSEQKLSECLSVLEEVLHLKRDEFGEESEHYMSTSHKLAEICNVIAMIFLNKDKPDSCLDFLRRAEVLAVGSSLFKSITYCNMAQYCKKTNKVKTAIQYLEKAQEIQVKQGNPVLLADTHLNMCALFSQQDRHQEALEHILVAVVLLQDEYSQHLLKQLQEERNNEGKKKESQGQDEGDEDLYSKLAIAYHNLGVEFEFLKRFEESLQTYDKAVSFARTNLGPQHELTKQFEHVSSQASQTINEARQKEAQKKKPANGKGIPASQVYATIEQQDSKEQKKPSSNNSSALIKSKRVTEGSDRSTLKGNSIQRQNSQDQNPRRQMQSQNGKKLNGGNTHPPRQEDQNTLKQPAI